MSLFNENQEEVEGALTPEVETKLEEERNKAEEESNKKIEEFQEETTKDIEELQEKKEKAEQEKTDLEEELEKEKDKGKNFGRLRDKVGQKEEIISSMKAEMEKLQGGLEEKINGIQTKASEEVITDAIRTLAGDDKDLSDKIRFHFDGFKKPEGKDEILKKVENAYVLATGGKPATSLTGAVLSSAGGTKPPEEKGKSDKLSEGAKDVAGNLGISDADMKKRNII